MIVKVDIPTKAASLTANGCTFSFRDGTTSPLGQGTACLFLVTGDPLKQFVSVRNGALTFGARDDAVTVSYTLDLASDLLDIQSSGASDVNEEECHRPHV